MTKCGVDHGALVDRFCPRCGISLIPAKDTAEIRAARERFNTWIGDNVHGAAYSPLMAMTFAMIINETLHWMLNERPDDHLIQMLKDPAKMRERRDP